MTTARNDQVIAKFLQDPLYRVERDGTIWTCKDQFGNPTADWRLAGGPNRYRDERVYWRVRYGTKFLRAHRIVWAKYRGLADPTLTINHIDGNGLNNCLTNLEMVTVAQNNLHAYRVTGRRTSGNRKITQEIARQIRIEAAKGMKQSALARKYMLSKSTVSYVVNNRTWRTK